MMADVRTAPHGRHPPSSPVPRKDSAGTTAREPPHMTGTSGAIAVLAPASYVSVTIEPTTDDDDIHFHAGGQGLWVARALRQLGHEPVACAPIGGESGRTLLGLVEDWGVRLQAVSTVSDTPAY